jgi:hypothetical protein
MKKLLLAGVAALFLATGAAHAINHHTWKCRDGVEVTISAIKNWDGKTPNAMRITYDVETTGLRSPNHRVRIKSKRDEPTQVYLGRKRCQMCFYDDCSEEGLKKQKEYESQ